MTIKEIQTALKAIGINKRIPEIDEFLQTYKINCENSTPKDIANLIKKQEILLESTKERVTAEVQTNDIKAILRANLLREYIKLLDLRQIEEVETLVKKLLIQKLQKK